MFLLEAFLPVSLEEKVDNERDRSVGNLEELAFECIERLVLTLATFPGPEDEAAPFFGGAVVDFLPTFLEGACRSKYRFQSQLKTESIVEQ